MNNENNCSQYHYSSTSESEEYNKDKDNQRGQSKGRKILGQLRLDEKMEPIIGYYPKNWLKEDLRRDYSHGAGQVACFGMRELDSLV